jgi:DNA-binding SARP family transcriptional activator
MWRDGVELNLGSPQQRAVLAYLLLSEGRHVLVDELVDGLWGSEVPVTGASTARTYLSRLRRVLADAELGADLVSSSRGYQLRVDPAAVDVNLFREGVRAARQAREGGDLVAAACELRAGLALWRGPALAGSAGAKGAKGAKGAAVGSFFEARRAWLGQLHATAVEERMEVDIELGGHAEVAAELAAAVMEQPYRERLWELLMLALYRSSRQAEALSTYRRVGLLLDRNLGLAPGPGLRRMHSRILAADPQLMEVANRAQASTRLELPSDGLSGEMQRRPAMATR